MDTSIYKVFVSKELSIQGHNGWGTYDRITLNNKDALLKCVETIEELDTVPNSWTYKNGYIYSNNLSLIKYINAIDNLNSPDFSVEMYYHSGIWIENCSDIVINDLNFDYWECCGSVVRKSDNVVFNRCSGSFQKKDTGMYSDYNSQVVYNNCIANYNRVDGFSTIGGTNTTFNNCIGCYNLDDGVSHHEIDSIGFINGGEYSFNGKGGIASPTGGSFINAINCVLRGNVYGIYAVDANNYTPNYLQPTFSGCLIQDSKSAAIKNKNGYTIRLINCIFKDNAAMESADTDSPIIYLPQNS